MKKTFLALLLATTVVLIPGALLSEVDTVCCRPICEGCGSGDRVCEIVGKEACRDLGGWPVESCEECYQF